MILPFKLFESEETTLYKILPSYNEIHDKLYISKNTNEKELVLPYARRYHEPFTKKEVKFVENILKDYRPRKKVEKPVVLTNNNLEMCIFGLAKSIDIEKDNDNYYYIKCISNPSFSIAAINNYYIADDLVGLEEVFRKEILKNYKKQDLDTESLREEIIKKLKTANKEELLKIKSIL